MNWLRVAFDLTMKQRCSYLKPSSRVPCDKVRVENWSALGMVRVTDSCTMAEKSKRGVLGEMNSRG